MRDSVNLTQMRLRCAMNRISGPIERIVRESNGYLL